MSVLYWTHPFCKAQWRAMITKNKIKKIKKIFYCILLFKFSYNASKKLHKLQSMQTSQILDVLNYNKTSFIIRAKKLSKNKYFLF